MRMDHRHARFAILLPPSPASVGRYVAFFNFRDEEGAVSSDVIAGKMRCHSPPPFGLH
jgi:hypothetical protein